MLKFLTRAGQVIQRINSLGLDKIMSSRITEEEIRQICEDNAVHSVAATILAKVLKQAQQFVSLEVMDIVDLAIDAFSTLPEDETEFAAVLPSFKQILDVSADVTAFFKNEAKTVSIAVDDTIKFSKIN